MVSRMLGLRPNGALEGRHGIQRLRRCVVVNYRVGRYVVAGVVVQN